MCRAAETPRRGSSVRRELRLDLAASIESLSARLPLGQPGRGECIRVVLVAVLATDAGDPERGGAVEGLDVPRHRADGPLAHGRAQDDRVLALGVEPDDVSPTARELGVGEVDNATR